MKKDIKIKGLYFDNDLIITPNTQVDFDKLTVMQAKRILKSEILNSMDSESVEIIRSLAEKEEVEKDVSTSIPLPERENQVYGSKLVDGKLIQNWVDLSEYVKDYIKIDIVDFNTDWSLNNVKHENKSFSYLGGKIPRDPAEYNGGYNNPDLRNVDGFQVAHKIKGNYKVEFTINRKDFLRFGILIDSKDYSLDDKDISSQYISDVCSLIMGNDGVSASTVSYVNSSISLADKKDTITLGMVIKPEGTVSTYIKSGNNTYQIVELIPKNDYKGYNLDTSKCRLRVFGIPAVGNYPTVTYNIKPIEQEFIREE